MSHCRHRLGPLVVCFALLTLSFFPTVMRGASDGFEKEQAALDAKILELIKKLGDTQFATREKAQSELEQLGLVAFDALYEAQDSDDIEIAMRARHLVRSMRVNWSRDDDPAEVKRILTAYGSQNQVERGSRMYRLAALPDGQGTAALCRLVRFEASVLLSKRGALLVIGQTPPEDAVQQKRLIDVIKSTVGLSKRPAVGWLRTYAASIEDAAASLSRWDELVKSEHETFTDFPDQSSREIVRDLMRWHVAMLQRLDRHEEKLAAMRRTIDLVTDTREDILETVDWLMTQEAWSLVDEAAKRFAAQFEQSPLLLYRLAESQMRQGNQGAAEKTSELALKASPEEPEAHVEAGWSLQLRGLFKWSEQEYRLAMKIGPTGSVHDLGARLFLSELLHDQLQELAAAEVLQGAVDAMDKDQTVADTLRSRWGREPGALASRMHFFYAQDFAGQKNHDKVIEHLDAGINADPTDVDVLIAMYRTTPPNDEWRTKTMHHLETATGFFRDQIQDLQQQASESPSEPLREWATRQLATSYNQFAWLISNTVGDYNEALQASRKSLEIRPDEAGYLDTLGRCYYATGDLDNAIKQQRRAVEEDPHSQQIRRQLEFFEKELAASKQKRTTSNDSAP